MPAEMPPETADVPPNPLAFVPESPDALPLHLLVESEWADWLADQPAEVQTWLTAVDTSARTRAPVVVPGAGGKPALAVAVLPEGREAQRQRFLFANARKALPAGTWHLVTTLAGPQLDEALLGWLLAGYTFTRYKAGKPPRAALVCPPGADAKRLEALAAAEALTRDLINTPASDMGPAELEAAIRALAEEFGAAVSSIVGEELLEKNLPMIHAVGRASPRDPRLVEMTWAGSEGASGPMLVLVGKGVCFDTGGLDLKPAAGMGLMKKDMGGAATVLGLARAIMALDLPLRLRVLIPAVENSVSGNSFRPQDVLHSRKGLTVEINNTDAEGRLVLADALALADEATGDDAPALVISMATLTGAARVAVGPDLAPFYATLDEDAVALSAAAPAAADPVWRMPFHEPYETLIEPLVGDVDNAPSGGMAGSITAALFLRRFVTECPRYLHFDIYGWQPTPAPARPKGGVGQGARAILGALPDLLGILPK